ncbi:MAG TPA: glycosyl transferase family protein [Pseudomonadales bacterium]|nr:glycosyl transferase family protein [Pseudomonadales bacterium]
MSLTNEHPFAQYIRALGKGKKGSRSLTREEARTAFGMVLNGEAEAVQVGAFLMLLRVKEESAEELAGFVEAVREYVTAPTNITVDLDWSSYAGKRKHLPWFILSTLLLAENGIRVFMHGSDGHTAGRIYTESCFRFLGLPIANNWQQVSDALDKNRLCFFHLKHWCPRLQELIDLRNTFGLRSPVHTLTRLVNPLAASSSLQSIFHPAYAENHQQAAFLLGQKNALVIKGDGGEFERRPDADCKLYLIHNNEKQREDWTRSFGAPQSAEEDISPELLRAVWRNECQQDYATEAVIGTAALALRAMQRALDQDSAYAMASEWWKARNLQRLP